MKTRKKYDLVATVGTYRANDGTEKKRHINVGSVFENEEGRISIKVDSVPVGQEWNGWLSCYEPTQRGESRPAAPAQSAAASQTDADEDRPF
jgi:hypothetical protein